MTRTARPLRHFALATALVATLAPTPPSESVQLSAAVAEAKRPPRPKRPPRHRNFHLLEATIGEIHRALKRREISCVELVELYLDRIEAYNGVCVDQPEGKLGFITAKPDAGQLNALMTLNLRPAHLALWDFDPEKARSLTDPVDDDPNMPDALETAAALDAYLASTGKPWGPLHCVPMAIKDQFDTFDMRTTAGMIAGFADDRPPDDATFILRLRQAGAIILAKANMGEMASGQPRSSFGGVLCNPYATDRNPGHSSGGSATSVAANLVTCAIGEETGGSILHPTKNNNIYGLVPTQETISRDGMIDANMVTRLGPMCRTVEDTARVFDVIVGYDPKDELTAFSVGRLPEKPYYEFTSPKNLKGMRIGVLREYMDPSLWNQADVESIQIQSAAVQTLADAGATLVDPGEGGALLQGCINELAPLYRNALFTAQFPAAFPAGSDHISTLLDMWFDPSLVPAGMTARSIGGASTTGQGTYMLTRYLRERGDAEIQTIEELANKSQFYTDIRPQVNFGDRKASLLGDVGVTTLSLANYFQNRFAYQVIVLQCMARMDLDALVSSCGTVPPYVLGMPPEPTLNNRGSSAINTLGQQGLPMLGMPAGFTTYAYDRVFDATAPGGTKQIGPIPARLPAGLMLIGRPFSEPTLFTIAAAYEKQNPGLRVSPADFGPLPFEP
jgi:Asp-tRNA(Asn)/Glu-tRNA(Gln) amidotransferase A subunit family amidase